MSKGERFSFRWGIPILDAAQGFTPIYDFMLQNYHRVKGRYVKDFGDHKEGEEWASLERREFLAIVHVAARHFNTPRGESRPSLKTIAKEMGYKVRGLQRVIRSLSAKGMIKITPRPGRTSVYDASPFASACLELWLEEQRAKREPAPEDTPVPQDTPRGVPQDTPPLSHRTPETKEETEEDKNNNIDVAVSSSPSKDKNSDGHRKEAYSLLMELPEMNSKVASRLAETVTPARVIEVVAASRARPDVNNLAGLVVSALSGGYTPSDPKETAKQAELRKKALDCFNKCGGNCGALWGNASEVCKVCPKFDKMRARGTSAGPSKH